jgi:hypothetical protein
MPPPALELGGACPGRVHALTAINTNTPHTTVSFRTPLLAVKRPEESMSLSLDRLYDSMLPRLALTPPRGAHPSPTRSECRSA